MSNQSKVFYGWWILLGAMLAMAFSIGLIYYPFSILVVPLQEQFGWTRSQISNAPMMWAFVVLFLMIPVGKLNDKYGPRVVMPVGAAISALALLIMAVMQSVWHFYAANLILAAGMIGLSQPVCTGTVARWFERLRGAAMGATIAGGAVGTFIASRIWPSILDSYGTSGVYVSCAAVALFLVLPYALLVMRRAPEDLGLKPYGALDEPTKSGTDSARAAPATEGLTSAEARRTANFWLLIGFTLLANLAYNAVAMHFVPIFEAGGIARERASHLLGYAILLSFVGKIAGGWVADHVSIRKFLSVIQIGFSLACVSLFFAGAAWQLPLFVLLWGTCLGFSAGAYTAIMPECFGTKELSAIMSSLFILQVFGAAFGPKLSGIAYDRTESYVVAFVGAAAFYLVTAALIFMTRPRFLAASKRNAEKTAPTTAEQDAPA